MDWEERLDDWERELELSARLEGSDWVTLEQAAADTGASRAALRSWYRTGQIPSRLVDGPHGPQRLVPLAVVAARAEASPRLRRSTERRLADQAQLEILRHRVDQLELRLAALEGRLEAELPKAEFHDREGFCPILGDKIFRDHGWHYHGAGLVGLLGRLGLVVAAGIASCRWNREFCGARRPGAGVGVCAGEDGRLRRWGWGWAFVPVGVGFLGSLSGAEVLA
jgi:hypothetical protein